MARICRWVIGRATGALADLRQSPPQRLRVSAVHPLKMAVVVASVALTSGVVWSQTREPATCPTRVVLRDVSYTPAEASEEIISGDELGTGEERGCGWKGPYTHEIGMNSIPGVDTGLAIASPVSAYTVYLPPGVTANDLPERFGTVTIPQR